VLLIFGVWWLEKVAYQNISEISEDRGHYPGKWIPASAGITTLPKYRKTEDIIPRASDIRHKTPNTDRDLP